MSQYFLHQGAQAYILIETHFSTVLFQNFSTGTVLVSPDILMQSAFGIAIAQGYAADFLPQTHIKVRKKRIGIGNLNIHFGNQQPMRKRQHFLINLSPTDAVNTAQTFPTRMIDRSDD